MPSHTGLRVFIIDDNEMTRSLLRLVIQGEKYDVVGDAATAESARARLRSVAVDLICLDVEMPDADGLTLLHWIRQRLPDCAVLMVSARNDRATVEQALRNGARGFIVKPFNPGTVVDTLDQIGAQLLARRAGAGARA